jgi:hypothetical protein
MGVDGASDRYRTYRKVGNGLGPSQIAHLFARLQRDRFALRLRWVSGLDLEAVPTGGLARGTAPHLPKDVDLMLVMPPPVLEGRSPEEALAVTQELIWTQVYRRPEDDPAQDFLTRLGDRAVQCDWVDLPFSIFEGLVPQPLPVNVMPAYRVGTDLMVPECSTGTWQAIAAEELTELVAQRQREWEHFTDIVRMVRIWEKQQDLGLRPVATEVLVLAFMPRPGRWQTLTRAEALARFFRTAADRLDVIRTPGTGAVMDPGPDYGRLRAALEEGAAIAREAVDAAADGNRLQAERLWEKMFGDAVGPGWLIATLRWVWGGRPANSPQEVTMGWPSRPSGEPPSIPPAGELSDSPEPAGWPRRSA